MIPGSRTWQRFSTAMLSLLLAGSVLGQKLRADSLRVYVGTYSGPQSKGIYLTHFDTKTGELGPTELAAPLASPSFLCISPDGKFLYAVSELGEFEGQKSGAVSALDLDPATGRLGLLNQQATRGGAPCHVSMDAEGRHVLVANYTGGNVAVFPVGKDGRLSAASAFKQHTGSSINRQRQEGPHAHGIYVDPRGRFALVPDLGLDQVRGYRFDPRAGSLADADRAGVTSTPGAGPRHLAFHPGGSLVCVIHELDCTVSSYRYDAERGLMTHLDTASTLLAPHQGNSTAEVAFHPNGRFVYGSNRGHDSIAVFSIDASSGKLALLQNAATGGRTPRHFAIDPTGRWLLAANQDSGSITVLSLDPQSGLLKDTGVNLKGVGIPVCLIFGGPR